MMRERRMIMTYGIMLAAAISVSIRQVVLVLFISDTIESTDLQVQFRLASLASAMFGIGQLVGSPLVGYVNDKMGGG
jgi:MFS family permease